MDELFENQEVAQGDGDWQGRVVDAQEEDGSQEAAQGAGESAEIEARSDREQGAKTRSAGDKPRSAGGADVCTRSWSGLEPVAEGAQRDREPGVADRAQQQNAQTREDNAAAKAARLRAETETKERLQRQFNEQVAGMNITNPYSGKAIGTAEELQVYGEQFRMENLKKQAKRQGKSVEELEEELENRSYVARKRQEEREQQQAMDALMQRNAYLSSDLDLFLQKFPNVDVVKLEQNPKFRKFAGKRIYREPLSELYADFAELMSDAERAAVEKATGRAARSTGGGQGGGSDMLSPMQRAELDEWNRDNPSLRMNAKEYLNR